MSRSPLLQLHLRELHLDLFLHAERLQDDVGVLEELGLLDGDLPGLEQLVDQRLIARDLRERALAPHVRARIADLRDQRRVAPQVHRRHGGAHARARQVFARLLEDLGVGFARRAAQLARQVLPLVVDDAFGRIDHVRVEHRRRQRLDGHPRGDLAGRGAAHAVAHDEQRAARAERVRGQLGGLARAVVEPHDDVAVLVVLADEAHVGATVQAHLDGAGGARGSLWQRTGFLAHHFALTARTATVDRRCAEGRPT